MGRRRCRRVQDKTVNWNESENGRRRQRQVSFPTAREAKLQADKFNARVTLRFIGQSAPVVCLQDTIREFLAAIRDASLADSTRRAYATSLGLLYRTTGDIPVNDITPAHMDSYLARARELSSSEVTPAKYYREARRFPAGASTKSLPAAMSPGPLLASPGRIPSPSVRLDLAGVDAPLNVCDTDDRRLAVLLGATTGIVWHRL